MGKEKVIVVFTNDEGFYYLETIEKFNTMAKTHNDWDIARVIDETEDWENFKLTKEELKSPTTSNGKQFIVITYLYK